MCEDLQHITLSPSFGGFRQFILLQTLTVHSHCRFLTGLCCSLDDQAAWEEVEEGCIGNGNKSEASSIARSIYKVS